MKLFNLYDDNIFCCEQLLTNGNDMKLTKEIDALILELTRKGIKPRYIVIGQNQYARWANESEKAHVEDLENQYMGCNIVICGSDILEVVPEPKDISSFYKRK